MSGDLFELVGALIAAAIVDGADDCQECAITKTPEWAALAAAYEERFYSENTPHKRTSPVPTE
jgi:hypothetical protein